MTIIWPISTCSKRTGIRCAQSMLSGFTCSWSLMASTTRLNRLKLNRFQFRPCFVFLIVKPKEYLVWPCVTDLHFRCSVSARALSARLATRIRIFAWCLGLIGYWQIFLNFAHPPLQFAYRCAVLFWGSTPICSSSSVYCGVAAVPLWSEFEWAILPRPVWEGRGSTCVNFTPLWNTDISFISWYTLAGYWIGRFDDLEIQASLNRNES